MLSDTTWQIIIAIGCVFATLALNEAYLFIKGKYRKRRVKQAFTTLLGNTRPDFFAKEFSSFVPKEVNIRPSTTIRAPEEFDDSITIYIYVAETSPVEDGVPLEAIYQYIHYGIGRQVAHVLRQQGYSEPIIQNLTPRYKEKFFEESIVGPVLKNPLSIEVMRERLRNEKNPALNPLFEAIAPTIYEQISRGEDASKINKEVEEKMKGSPIETQKDELLKTLTQVEVSEQDQSKQTSEKIKLSKEATQSLQTLRSAFEKGTEQFMAAAKQKLQEKKILRSEQIYIYILLFPGNYAAMFHRATKIPSSTWVRYTAALERMKFIERRAISKGKKHVKELYPYSDEKKTL